MTAPLHLSADSLGRLTLTLGDDPVHHHVIPVRAFPIAAPDDGIALVGDDGRELAWIDRLAALPGPTQTLIRDALHRREFMPEIRQLLNVSTFATPSSWTVDTDRGQTTFILKGEDDIRRLPGNGLLVADAHGIQFRIRDLTRLDRHSRRLLDRFL